MKARDLCIAEAYQKAENKETQKHYLYIFPHSYLPWLQEASRLSVARRE